jgi:hypothetical protein
MKKVINSLDFLIHLMFSNIKKRLWFLYPDIVTNYDKNDSFCHIDLLITLIDKDIMVAKKCIESVKLHSLNKIRNVYIVAPDTVTIRGFCKENNCSFINEDSVSPYTSIEILSKGIGMQRVGWIKQQLIKLNSDNLIPLLDRYLIIDADTILLKKQFFSKNGRDVLKFSDEFHFLYKFSSKLILGSFFYSMNSFIAHHQLIQKATLSEMKKHISNFHKKEWYDVFIDAALNNSNFVSEYELYAQFCIKNKRENIIAQYWFNINDKFKNFKKLNKTHPKAQSVSFHNYEFDVT